MEKMMYDAVKDGEVVFTGTLKECNEYADVHSDEQFVFVKQGSFTVQGVLEALEGLKKGLQEADTFGWYTGEYEMIRQFLVKAGEAK